MLRGRHALLAPLALEHHDASVDAVRDGEVWRLWYTAVPAPHEMRDEIARRLELQARGTMLPFAAIDARTERVVAHPTERTRNAPSRLRARTAARGAAAGDVARIAPTAHSHEPYIMKLRF